MPWALPTAKSFTTQENVWEHEANELPKSKAKGNKLNAAVALTDYEVNILYEEYLH